MRFEAGHTQEFGGQDSEVEKPKAGTLSQAGQITQDQFSSERLRCELAVLASLRLLSKAKLVYAVFLALDKLLRNILAALLQAAIR
jgi:hypothetical protein